MDNSYECHEVLCWPTLGGCLLALLGYADDLALIARNMRALSSRMLRLEDTRACLSISSKTKLLHLNTPVTQSLPLKHLMVDPVSSFTYLGSDVNSTLDLSATIQDRINKCRIRTTPPPLVDFSPPNLDQSQDVRHPGPSYRAVFFLHSGYVFWMQRYPALSAKPSRLLSLSLFTTRLAATSPPHGVLGGLLPGPPRPKI